MKWQKYFSILTYFVLSISSCTSNDKSSKDVTIEVNPNYKGYAFIYAPKHFQIRNEGIFLKPIDIKDTSVEFINSNNNIIYNVPLMHRHRIELYKSRKGISCKFPRSVYFLIPGDTSIGYQVFRVKVELRNYRIYDYELDRILDTLDKVCLSRYYLKGDSSRIFTKLEVLDFINIDDSSPLRWKDAFIPRPGMNLTR